jgi:hypothetical protein
MVGEGAAEEGYHTHSVPAREDNFRPGKGAQVVAAVVAEALPGAADAAAEDLAGLVVVEEQDPALPARPGS